MTWFLDHYNMATAMKFNVMKALPNLYRCPFYIPWLYAFEYLLPIALHWICGALASKLHTRACSESLRDRHRNPCRPKFIATPGLMGYPWGERGSASAGRCLLASMPSFRK